MGITQKDAITRQDEELERVLQDVTSNGHTPVWRTTTIGRPETSLTTNKCRTKSQKRADLSKKGNKKKGVRRYKEQPILDGVIEQTPRKQRNVCMYVYIYIYVCVCVCVCVCVTSIIRKPSIQYQISGS